MPILERPRPLRRPGMRQPNKPAAANPGIASFFQAGRHRRKFAEPER